MTAHPQQERDAEEAARAPDRAVSDPRIERLAAAIEAAEQRWLDAPLASAAFHRPGVVLRMVDGLAFSRLDWIADRLAAEVAADPTIAGFKPAGFMTKDRGESRNTPFHFEPSDDKAKVLLFKSGMWYAPDESAAAAPSVGGEE